MLDPAKTKRIRSIVQRHVEALGRDLAQELTQELTQPLLQRFGLTVEDVVTVPDVITTEATAPPVAEPIGSTTLSYDPRTRRWVCPRCRKFSDTRRRAVTTHARFCDGVPEPRPTPAAPQARRKRKKKS